MPKSNMCSIIYSYDYTT